MKSLHQLKLWQKVALAAIVLLFLVPIGLTAYKMRASKPRPAYILPVQQTTETPAPPLNPLQIEAIKARSYPGSVITAEQNLGNQGGYKTEIISYMSDGLKIYALQATPTGNAPAGGWPVVILNHGYINPTVYRTNDGSYTGLISTLAQSGFVVVKPDYRGHGQSQGVPEGGHFSPVYNYDDLNLIASLKSYPLVSAGRIGTLGHSLGGHTSLRVAVVSPDVKATVYLSGVVGSIYDILYNWPHSPMPGDLPATVQATREQLLAQYGTPHTNPAFWDSVSAINFVSGITGKSQVHTSVADSVVPAAFSAHLNDALVAAAKPVEYYVYPGNDHQFSANSALAYDRIVAFYKNSL